SRAIFDAMRAHGVDHYCAAPIVHNMLVNAEAGLRGGRTRRVRGMVAGAAPPAAMIEGMARIGFELTHAYGLTETYGPAAVAAKREQWAAASLPEQTRLNGRQGVRYVLQEGMTVLDPETMTEVAPDAQTLGEIMFRGNIVMKGYLKNPTATAEAFAGGWFHSGDLAVLEPDRYVKIKDRSKDVIISGGENISSLEVEDALYRHPAVMACAVVARPDPKWGETPLAFVELKSGVTASAALARVLPRAVRAVHAHDAHAAGTAGAGDRARTGYRHRRRLPAGGAVRPGGGLQRREVRGQRRQPRPLLLDAERAAHPQRRAQAGVRDAGDGRLHRRGAGAGARTGEPGGRARAPGCGNRDA